MVSTRPLPASTTTTDPLYCPSDSTAARRMSRSSPSTLSPSVESAYVGLVQGPPATIPGPGATGRGPATATFCVCTAATCTPATCTPATRAGARDATDAAGLTGAFRVRCVALASRCLCLTVAVAAKPLATRRWRDKANAMMRDATAKNDLLIGCTHSPCRRNRAGLLARAGAAIFDRSSRILNSVHWDLGPSSEFFHIVPFRTSFARNSKPRNSKQRNPILWTLPPPAPTFCTSCPTQAPRLP